VYRACKLANFFYGFNEHSIFFVYFEANLTNISIKAKNMKSAIRYGLIYGGLSVVWSLMTYITGVNRSDSSSIIQGLSIIIPIVCCVLAVKEYKATIGGGFISFGKAFKESMIVCLVGIIIAGIFSVIYTTYIDPTFMEFVMNKQYEKMEEDGMSPEMIEMSMNQAKMFTTPAMQLVFALFGGMFIGTVISLVVAGVMKNPNPEEIA
jgi:hypothetical protein